MIFKHIKKVLILAICATLLTTARIDAQNETSGSAPQFSEFKIIAERSIFDPSRTATRKSSSNREARRVQPPDRLTLSGVLIDDNQAIAFFEGSKSEFNKQLKTGANIAGYIITSIHTDIVVLEKDDRQIKLPVGSSLTKRETADWEISSTTSFEGYAASKDNSQKETGDGAMQDDSSNDLLKKMMERRRQEMGQ